jgi:streptogramin lyase
VSKILPDGTVAGTYPVAGRQMAADAAGNLWVTGTALTKLSPTGAVLGTFPIDSSGVAVATDGIIWVTGAKTRRLYKLSP